MENLKGDYADKVIVMTFTAYIIKKIFMLLILIFFNKK